MPRYCLTDNTEQPLVPPHYRKRFDHRIHKVIDDCYYTNQLRQVRSDLGRWPGPKNKAHTQDKGRTDESVQYKTTLPSKDNAMLYHHPRLPNHEIDLQHNSPSKCMVARSASMFAWRSWIWGLPALHCCRGAVSVSVYSEYRSNIDGLSERVREMG